MAWLPAIGGMADGAIVTAIRYAVFCRCRRRVTVAEIGSFMLDSVLIRRTTQLRSDSDPLTA